MDELTEARRAALRGLVDDEGGPPRWSRCWTSGQATGTGTVDPQFGRTKKYPGEKYQ
ncbi:hypothetical protein NU688_30920 [Variovorax sp. ZS18.2.2]|uniref:hypothetical protein n=1 Tax=Variovorax sp. ZS18.2.2 TaxID=2971255 RepID=UPI002150B9DB|nr:hypothetical protein [Variovorax sp. ZS18.2.2]MCR6480602.1 hypothetical protein [Variovorax sp. ZS18.2.2]